MAPKDTLVVVLIIAHSPNINEFEQIALNQCCRVLGNYPIRLVCPDSMNTDNYRRIVPDLEIDYITPHWTSSYDQFNRLKIEPFLYKRYKSYKYILFYELDAFVFRDELEYWCSRDFDYIGAPWIDLPWMGDLRALKVPKDRGCKNAAVGNGGFSLRNVQSALRVLRSFSYILDPNEVWEASRGRPLLKRLLSLAKNISIANNSLYIFNDFVGNEDLFWGIYVKRKFDWFRVASVEEALSFSLECKAHEELEKRGGILPFGCHGWWKQDQDFWLPLVRRAT